VRIYNKDTRTSSSIFVYNAGPKYVARGSLEMQDPKNRKKIAIRAPLHNFVGQYLRN